MQTLTQNMILPPAEFQKNSTVSAPELYLEAKLDRLKFWEKQADCLDWYQRWHTVLDWNPPYAKWFEGGKLNACYNCVDRHQTTEMKNKKAIIWEGERGDTRTLTYEDLYREVNKCSHVLKILGVSRGDTVAIYMPMIPEAVIAMLACARIGAIHTVVFGGFSSDALKDRLIDADAKLLITADGGFRKGAIVPLKEAADRAMQGVDSCQKMLVIHHAGHDITMHDGRDYWYHELMAQATSYFEPEKMDAEDRLFILYTSGTTGKPKGIVHTTGGYLVGAMLTCRWIFDIKSSDVYWCTADIGWITGHSYVVYGPLSNGMTQFIYEGAPDYPGRDRIFRMIQKYGITTLYTAPTLIRAFMKWGEGVPKSCDLSSLRLLGSVGEPINPEAWNWYYRHIGNSNCPIVDTWWQTETGSFMVAPFAAHTPLKPGSATFAMPGIDVEILDEKGNPSKKGLLAITSPWPSMLRGIHKDPERFKSTYWSKWDKPYYFTGDGCMQDDEGYFWLMGRVDDVMNISGHRIGTMEVESALVDYPLVAEAACVGIEHCIKGQAICAFVILKEGNAITPELESTLKQHVVAKIGPIARPERIIFTRDLPKTRSGKIMRRLLRDIGEGKIFGDVSTLADSSIVNELKEKYSDD